MKSFNINTHAVDNSKLSVRSAIFVGLYSFLFSFAIIIAQRGEVMISNVLVADDQSYVVDFLLFDVRARAPNLYYLQLMVNWFGVEGSRVFLGITTAISASAISVMLYLVFRNFVVPLAPAFALAIPASMSQYIFLNGSHPTAALPVVAALLIFIVCLQFGRSYQVQIGSAVGALAASALALSLTPVAPGVSIAALVCLAANLASWRAEKLKLFLLFLVSISGPVLFFINSFVTQAARNHYLDRAGWVDTSPARIFAQLAGFISSLESNAAVWLVLAVMAVCLILTTVYGYIHTKRYGQNLTRPAVVLSMLFLIAGALSFVPALVVPSVQDRYFEIPVFLVATGGLIVLFSILAPLPGKVIPAAIVLIALISVSLVGRTGVQDHFERATRITNQIQESLPSDLPENAQIVIVGERLPFSGFNHWSTGLLQYLTGRTDIIGLIGPTSSIGLHDPIVDRWVRHSREYWFMGEDGRERRKRMVGLELGRPTFGYRFDEAAGVLLPTAVVAGDGSRALRADHGRIFSPVHASSLGSEMSCGPTSPDQPDPDARDIILGALPPQARPGPTEFFDLPASDAAPIIELRAGGPLEVHLHFEPENTSYPQRAWDDTFPPTPLLARDWFQFSQLEGDYWAVSSGSNRIVHRGADAELSVSFVPGCGIQVRLGGAVMEIQQTDSDVVRMTLGQGFRQRTWDGRVGVATVGGGSAPE